MHINITENELLSTMEITEKNHKVSVKYFFSDKKFAGVDSDFEVFGITDGVGLDVINANRKTTFSEID